VLNLTSKRPVLPGEPARGRAENIGSGKAKGDMHFSVKAESLFGNHDRPKYPAEIELRIRVVE